MESLSEPRIAEYVPAILAVPQPVKRKKRVTRTVYWEECPKCGRRLDAGVSWEQDTSLPDPERIYWPCGCVVRAGDQSDGKVGA